MDIDDQPANVMSVKAFLQGGVAQEDGINYPGKFFTDGCGNNKPYSMGIAMTAHSNYNDGDLTTVPSLLSATQLTNLVASGFLLENHGFYHEQDQYYVTNNFTVPRNILENTNFIYDKTGFVSRIWVTPSNYTGYNPYVQQQGFMAATSQSVTDGYTSQPVNMWTDHLADLSQLDTSFNVFLRDFTDDWANTTVTNELKTRISSLRSKSSSTVHKIYRLGTHSYNSNNWQGFKSFFDYVDTTSGNTIWIASLQELLEYREVKRKLLMTQSLKNNVLTIKLDLSKVPTNNSFRDISLLVDNSAAISSVSVLGADAFSYNSSGLINIYSRKIVFNPPYNRPAPNAGADQQIILPIDSVLLKGSLKDTTVSIVSYNWSKVSGPGAGIIADSSQTTTLVKGLVQGNYVFRLTAIDSNGIRGTDDVGINVISIVSPESVYHVEAESWTSMFGVQTEACSDTGGTLDVGWVDNGDWMDYGLTIGSSGTYQLNLRIATPYSGAQLIVKNSVGSSLATVNIPTTGGFQKWQTVTVPVNLIAGSETLRLESSSAAGWNINWMELVGAAPANQPPTANAGADQAITLPASSVTLSGSGTDTDGTISSYSWSKISGGAATITAPASASTTVTGLTQGTYTFRLAVTDNSGATSTDDVVITVNAAANQLPTANAGNDQTITQPQSSVSLSGSGTDPDGSIASYSWTKVSGVGGTITSPSSAATTVTGLSAGTYVFRLTVTDNSGATATDDVNVVVNSASNQLPTASAGLDQTITLPATLTLSGSGTDPDGTIASYSWTKVSGGSATITSPSASSTTVTGLAAGSYTFRLTVTDNGGATAFDEVNVTVNAAPANQPPTASAGPDQSITLPVSSVTLSGSGTDPDGSIASYSWTKVSGTGGTITSPASASTTVTGLTQGSYTFRLTVTDNSGASATDDVVITVNQQPTPTYIKRIEAESYTSTVGTVSTAATTDLGGTLQVGGLDNNDVLNYTVDVQYSGTYNVNFRVGATKGGSRLQLLSSSATLLATINVPNTGTAWQTVSVPVNLTAGNAQTFKVVVNKSSGNPLFNWWEINLSSLSAASITSKEAVEVNYEVTEQSSWNIYPKPVHNQANIEINDPHTGIIKVQIWSIAGVLQRQFTRNKTALQFHDVIFVDDLPKGEYILRLEINNVSRSMKFIKL